MVMTYDARWYQGRLGTCLRCGLGEGGQEGYREGCEEVRGTWGGHDEDEDVVDAGADGSRERRKFGGVCVDMTEREEEVGGWYDGMMERWIDIQATSSVRQHAQSAPRIPLSCV